MLFIKVMLHIIPIIIIFSFPIICYFFYFKIIEKRTQNIIAQLPTNLKGQFLNATIWFKDFDMMKQKKFFSIDPFRVLYSFDLADLYVLTDKLIVVGKTKILGKTILLPPFAICWTDNPAEYQNLQYLTKQINIRLDGSDVEILFEDHDYSNQIKLVVKKIGYMLYDLIKS